MRRLIVTLFCGWILWAEGRTIQIADSFETMKECKTARDGMQAANDKRVKERPSTTDFVYTCAPDTIDLRKAKG